MSDGEASAGRFQWVDPASGSPAPRRRRWWWIAGAVVAVVMLVAGAVTVWPKSGDHPAEEHAQPAWPPPAGTPPERLLPFSLSQPLVTGWSKSPDELGLPPDGVVGIPFGGGEHTAYLLGTSNKCTDGGPCPPKNQAWVYGVDTRTGELLFPPVELPEFNHGVECYANGPSTAVCLAHEPNQIWVIDLDHGELIRHGTSDYNLTFYPRIDRIGDRHGQSRAVVVDEGHGIYGIDDHGQRSWFIPGSGRPHPLRTFTGDDYTPLELAAQNAPGGMRVFSLLDGTDLTPTPPPGTRVAGINVYNGGFLVIAEDLNDYGRNQLLFYDTTGALKNTRHLNSIVNSVENPVMPTLLTELGLQVYTADGTLQAQLPVFGASAEVRTIGTTMFTASGADNWQAWDLTTSEPLGADCHPKRNLRSSAYTGSDGAAYLTTTYDGYAAVDIATCATLWYQPSQGHRYITKVGDTLLQITSAPNRSTRLSSLRAP